VPAELSSPIPSGLDPLCDADPLQQAETPHLLAYLASVPDPRAPRGRRHPLIAILAVAAAAVLAGACSMTAIAEWAAEAPQPVRAALGARRDAPGHYGVPTESTIRRTLGRLDPQALATAIGAWLCDRDRPQQQRQWRRAIAVDGKTLRAARRDGRQVHLLAAMDHTTRTVLTQRQVDGAPGEVPAFQPLLDGLDLAGAVITADALHTHADTAEVLVSQKQAHYLLVVKANQPTLLERCAVLAWHNVPVADRTRDRGHGRVEIRILKAVSVRHFGFPHAAQVLQVIRKVCDLATRKWHTVIVYAITSLSFQQARPARLADLIRSHWTIENGLHWVRDVTFAEDASQLRTGTAPQVMSSLRNLAIGVLSRAGPVNLAAALRRHARDPTRPLATLGISLG
jgi:predicted transposase YbfD/YdcC